MAVGPHALESLQRHLGGNVGMIGDERLVAGLVHHQLVAESFEVGEANRLIARLEREFRAT